MQKRKNGIAITLACLTIVGWTSFTGCGSSTTPLAADANPQIEATSQAESNADLLVAINRVDERLVGIWLGEASIDMVRLEEKLLQLPAEQRKDVLHLVDEFLTTAMAVDFRADGSLEQELELVSSAGQPLRDGGTGDWRVVQSNSKQVLIETKTKLIDGTIVTDQQLYRFHSDVNQLAKIVDLGDELSGCDAQIVLRRQQLPDSNLAEQTDGSQTR